MRRAIDRKVIKVIREGFRFSVKIMKQDGQIVCLLIFSINPSFLAFSDFSLKWNSFPDFDELWRTMEKKRDFAMGIKILIL
jgi:hypothetical protein